MDRADTINSLALAMGVSTEKEHESRYDSKTGTLYCNGRTINSDVITNAITYFENMKSKCERSGIDNIQTVISYYDAAATALRALQVGW